MGMMKVKERIKIRKKKKLIQLKPVNISMEQYFLDIEHYFCITEQNNEYSLSPRASFLSSRENKKPIRRGKRVSDAWNFAFCRLLFVLFPLFFSLSVSVCLYPFISLFLFLCRIFFDDFLPCSLHNYVACGPVVAGDR